MVRSISHTLLVGLVALFVAVLSVPLFSFAQGGEGLQISPAVIEDKVDPGEVYDFTLTVTNISQSEKNFFLVKEDISGIDDQGLPIFEQEGEVTEYQLSSWVTLPQETVVLGPGETRSLPFVVNVPENATPGAHFGGIFLDARPDRLRITGAGVGLKVGSIVSLQISGDVIEEGQLREFSTDQIIYSAPDVKFAARVQNNGNTLLRPRGLIEISDMFGKEVGIVRINDSAAAVFPQTAKLFTESWTHDEFAFGRYQAILSMVYGEDGRRTISSTASFWVFPFKTILTALGILVGIILVLYIYVRLYINAKLRQMAGSSKKKGNVDYYARKYNRSASRLIMIVSAVSLFSIVFLGFLFLMFA